MSRIRGRDTKPEIVLRKALWSRGLRYRLHYRIAGRPDLVFVSAKVAVFVDGCFWHGCPQHGVMPKTNVRFWSEKLKANADRDKRVKAILRSEGWRVLRVWEHDIRDRPNRVVSRVIMVVRTALMRQE